MMEWTDDESRNEKQSHARTGGNPKQYPGEPTCCLRTHSGVIGQSCDLEIVNGKSVRQPGFGAVQFQVPQFFTMARFCANKMPRFRPRNRGKKGRLVAQLAKRDQCQ